MPETRLDLPQGTLDLLILKALSLEPMHGWAISGPSENNRKAKYYDLTKPGRKQLASSASHWARLTSAVGLVLDMK